ncbi:uncharacterized protein DC041_0001352 [Schistosoma bovis]|uniref:Potassium voltage-gated channel Eag-related subfamily H member 5 n=1 Tax=Schistosoma bovis TaxID=6184 RepID=A0A430QJB0_SCHBO|nr:uncharacterized protein DC041_0001352 [Schistosoma bovis]
MIIYKRCFNCNSSLDVRTNIFFNIFFLLYIINTTDKTPDSCFLLTNARILDFPIVYVSNGFTNLTEFGRIEVMQKPGLCPFLHGPQTDKSIITTLENAFKEQKSEHVEVILYKKNLTPLCILVEIIPIRNDEDLVVLFLITFRDLTAFRQPLKEESAQTSALGAFAAASDAGSSWGKFARLVFAMVRQKAEDSITGNPEQIDSPQLNIENETIQCVQSKSTEKQQHQQFFGSDKNVNNTNEFTTNNNNNNNSNSNSNTNDEIELIIPLTQWNQRKSTKSCHHFSTSDNINNLPSNIISSSYVKSLNKLETGELNLYNLEIKSKKHKYNIFKKRINKQSNNTILNSKKLGNIKGTNINGDVDDLFSNQWSAPESVPRYRPEPPCPPKHVLLHYSVFRIVWDWTILLLTGYTAIIVPLRVAVIPRPAWIPSSESLTVRTNNQKEWIHPTTLELLTIMDAIIDIIFGVDIVLNFHTSFVGAGGEVVADPPVIRMNYLSGWFTLDLLACLPYEILKYCWPVDNTEVYYLMDALRIIRLLRIGRAARRIDQYLEYVSTLLLLMILCFFLLAHWFACAWYAVGIFDIENKIYYGWIPRIYNDSLKPQNWEEFTLYDNSLTVSMLNLNKTQLLSQHITNVHNSLMNFALINTNSQSIPSTPRTSSSSATTSLSSSMKSKNQFYQSINITNCSINKICVNKTLQNDTLITINLDQQEYKQNNNIYHHISTLNLPLQNSREKWTAYITALYFSLSLLTTIGFGNVAAFTESEKLLSICCMLIGALVYATIFGNVTTIVQQMYATRTRYNEMMKGVKDFLKIHEVPRELGERVIDYITSSWSVTKGIDTVKVLNYCPKDMQADISVHLNRCVFNSHAAFRLASDGCRRSLAVNFQTLHTAPGDLICHQGESVDQLCFIASGTLEVLQDDEVIAILVSVPAAASVRALTYCTLHTIRLDRLRVVLNFYHAFANSFTRNLELTYNLCNRVIFRKLSDVRREMELSMRRNKEPPLSSLPANHPVRKLISRFRRSSQVGDLSSRQYLGTIVSYNTSLDGSEFENSSISDVLVNSTAEKPGSVCKSPLPSNDTHIYQSNDPKITTPISSPVKITPKNSVDSQLQSEPPVVVTANSLKGQNPARKWARLISKATQPPLHNLNEEANEDSNRLPPTQVKNLSKIQLPTKSLDDQNFTSTPVTTVVPLTTDPNPIIVSTQTLISYTTSLNTITTMSAMNSTNLTPNIPCHDLHRIELNIEKCFDNFHIKLSQQINEIVKRLDNLEGQIVELRNTFPNPINTSITEPKIDHIQSNTPISTTTNNNNSNNNVNNNDSTANNHFPKICIK